jgi:D-sedoheptulose 7-phosphate isomerase
MAFFCGKMTKKQIIKRLREAFEKGNKVLIFGNGGSAAEASHLAAEFIGIGLPAIALTDPSVVTSLGNDFGFNTIFSRQIFALGNKGDVAIGISSSGKSFNVNAGLRLARISGLTAIDFPRKGIKTATVQNNQLKLIHEIYQAFK